LLWSSDSESCW